MCERKYNLEKLSPVPLNDTVLHILVILIGNTGIKYCLTLPLYITCYDFIKPSTFFVGAATDTGDKVSFPGLCSGLGGKVS